MSAADPGWIRPDWPVSGRVRALITTRAGGVSTGPWGVPPSGTGGMNVGLLAGDAPDAVRENRARLRAALPSEPRWLKQVHGPTVVRADDVTAPPEADAAFTTTPGVVAAVMVADCMPVLLADVDGRCVGVAHAGWRGVASGVIQATVRAMRAATGCGRGGTGRLPGAGDRPRALRGRPGSARGHGGRASRGRGGLPAARRQVHGGPLRAGAPGAAGGGRHPGARRNGVHVQRPGAFLQLPTRPRDRAPCSARLDRPRVK